jgi:glycosyltransferase involved in cell wall biosynthesis
MKKLRVGYIAPNYIYKRNILGIVKEAEYKRASDAFRPGHFVWRVFEKAGLGEKTPRFILDAEYTFKDFGLTKVDLMHLYNSVSYGRTPWISTFETMIPRFPSVLAEHHQEVINYPKNDKNLRRGFAAIADKPCRKIIAISESAANVEREMVKAYPQFENAVLGKLIVMHPPQQVYVERFADKGLDLGGEIRFLFVGRNFFFKGGREMVEAFARVRAKDKRVKLTIVSELLPDDFASFTSQKDSVEARGVIEANSDWITHLENVSNDRVLELMKTHHVGMLPSVGDSYGFVVLEFQANGCPVVTTDIRVMPEINGGGQGWIIPVPKNPLGSALFQTEAQRKTLSECLVDGLVKTLEQILADPSQIATKADLSIAYVKQNHSPQLFAEKMAEVYREALAS